MTFCLQMADSRESRGKKRGSGEIGICILCQGDCDEDKSNTPIEAWETLKNHAKNWEGLDKYGSVYDEVEWENGLQGVFYHKLCRAQIASKDKLSKALKQKKSAEKSAENCPDRQIPSSSNNLENSFKSEKITFQLWCNT